MLGKAEIAVPSRNKNHVVSEILPLYLELLHDDDICLKGVEHKGEGSVFAPWLIAKGVPNAINVPGGDSEAHFERIDQELVFVVTSGGLGI